MRKTDARSRTSPTICHCGTFRPERPTWVIDWVRARCIVEVDGDHATGPADRKNGGHFAPQQARHQQRRDDIGGGEDGR